jgi:hypothetical protein
MFRHAVTSRTWRPYAATLSALLLVGTVFAIAALAHDGSSHVKLASAHKTNGLVIEDPTTTTVVSSAGDTLQSQADAVCAAADAASETAWNAYWEKLSVDPASVTLPQHVEGFGARLSGLRGSMAQLKTLTAPPETMAQWTAFLDEVDTLYSALQQVHDTFLTDITKDDALTLSDFNARVQAVAQSDQYQNVAKSAQALGLKKCFAPD